MTFDDVPHSAVRHGVPVLLEHEAEATFYVAAGLQPEDGYLNASDIEVLTAHGFDLACHTFSHYRLKQGTSRGLAADAERNRLAFERELQLRRPRDFAYPFGEVNASVKRRIEKAYATARSVYPGINTIGSDLLLLRANPLFSSSVRWDEVRRLLDRATEANAWVIFYTHGVDPDPPERGCTPADLDRLLGECRRAGLAMRSVRSVSEELLPGWAAAVADP
jgi:peptidoglycan/xylan/chitin deacetylase (PgdA/CDA1 family)